jgi:hypothetical protein
MFRSSCSSSCSWREGDWFEHEHEHEHEQDYPEKNRPAVGIRWEREPENAK